MRYGVRERGSGKSERDILVEVFIARVSEAISEGGTE